MSKNLIYIGIVGLVVLIGGVVYLMRPPAAPSVPVDVNETAQTMATVVPAEPTEAAVPAVSAGPTEAAVTQAVTEAAPSENSSVVAYSILSSESTVSFAINEVLRGDPYTAIGQTNQVTGELSVNYDEASAVLSAIQVNARTLKTNSSMRDRMIANEILDTGEYEFITFTPTQISGLPESAVAGDEIKLTIEGDLTVRNVTKQVTFEAVVKLVSLTRLEGRAEATVLRSAFGITIPEVPSVASVDDQVLITIVFVAEAQQ